MRPKLIFTLSITTLPVILSIFAILSFFSYESHWEGKGEVIPIMGGGGGGGGIGAESFAFDPKGGGPYTGVSDGRIIKWVEKERRWIDFAFISPAREDCKGPQDHDPTEHICGRPLGLDFDETNGNLYIADAYMGLLMVGPQGGLATSIATHLQGIPFTFTNALDIDQSSELIYFTDSSSQYPRRNHISVILSGDKSGKLMKYNPKSKQVTMLLGNLSFPNGIALSQDGNSMLLAETTNCRILKYWLTTSKSGNLEVFAQLPGFPDNIKRSPRGGYWVGVHSKRDRVLKWIVSHPWIGKFLLKLPFDVMKVHSFLGKFRGSGLALRLSEDGEVLEMRDGRDYKFKSISEVMEKDGELWIGSINLPFVGRFMI